MNRGEKRGTTQYIYIQKTQGNMVSDIILLEYRKSESRRRLFPKPHAAAPELWKAMDEVLRPVGHDTIHLERRGGGPVAHDAPP